jgi:hypothetical protein
MIPTFFSSAETVISRLLIVAQGQKMLLTAIKVEFSRFCDCLLTKDK